MRPSRRSLRGRGRRSPFRGERRRVRWGASSSRILQFDVVIPGSRGQIFQLREHGWRIQGGGCALGGSKTLQAGRPERQAFLSLGSRGGQVHVQGARSSVSETLSPRLAEGHLPPVSSRGRERALVSLSRGPHPQDLTWPSSPPQARLHAPSPWGSSFGVRRCRSATPVLEGVLCIQREWRFTGHWSLVVPQRG